MLTVSNLHLSPDKIKFLFPQNKIFAPTDS